MNDIWQVLIATGTPTAFIGFLFWLLSKRIDQRDREHLKKLEIQEKEHREREKVKRDHEILMIQCLCASLSLGEVTAKAIRDGRTNGEISEALVIVNKAKEAQKIFLHEQSIQNLF